MRKILCFIVSTIMCLSFVLTASAGPEEIKDLSGMSYGYAGTVNDTDFTDGTVNLNMGSQELENLKVKHSNGTVIQNSGDSAIIVRNSYIEGDADGETAPLEGNPGNLLVAGNIRTTLAMGHGQGYYINSTIVSKNWAALSTDAAAPAKEDGKELSVFAYGSKAETLEGGYGAYSDIFCNLYSYGSYIKSAEIGIISGTYGKVTIGDIEAGEADEALAAVLTEKDKAANADKSMCSIVEGGRNAMMIHSVNLPPYWEFESYSEEECPLHSAEVSVHDSVLRTDLNLDKGIEYDDQKQAYIDHTAGSVILIKSTNAEIELENSRLEPDENGTGYLIQTVYNNDTMFMNAVPEGEYYPGINVKMKDMSLKGEIAHEDYQRDFVLTLTSSDFEGSMNEYGFNHWKEAAEEEGFTDYCLDEYYETHHGLEAELKENTCWTVTAESHLSRLLIGSGCDVEGKIYVNDIEQPVMETEYTGDVVVVPLWEEYGKQEPETYYEPETHYEPGTNYEPETEHVHNWVRENGGNPATCTADGNKFYHCSICGESYIEVLPAAGHDMQYSYSVTKTCLVSGYDVYKCSRCEYEEVLNFEEATGHDYELVYYYPATCISTGQETYQCRNCPDIVTNILPTIPHNYELVYEWPVSCTSDGYETFQCTECTDIFTITTPAWGHDYYVTTWDNYNHVWICNNGCGDVIYEAHDGNPCSICGFEY